MSPRTFPRPIYGDIKRLLIARGFALDESAVERPDGELREFVHPDTGKRLTLIAAVLAEGERELRREPLATDEACDVCQAIPAQRFRLTVDDVPLDTAPLLCALHGTEYLFRAGHVMGEMLRRGTEAARVIDAFIRQRGTDP